MNKLKIYLDTSIINFLFADDAPEKKEITIDYFRKYVATNFYTHGVSGFVIEEIRNTKNIELREKLLNKVDEYDLEVWPNEPNSEIISLAAEYLKEKIIPEKSVYDALHVAFCTINKIDYLLSWNYRHLSNINKERAFSSKNLDLGYLVTPRLINPLEAFDD